MSVTYITPELTLESSSLFKPHASKPTEPPKFYAKLLASATAIKHPLWTAMETAVDELGRQHFGPEYATLVKTGRIRLPFRRDVHDRNWPIDIAEFLSVNSGADYKPAVVGRDAMPIMNQADIYPGCKVRASLRLYAYGGKGTSYSPGISFGLNNLQKLADGPRLATARGDGSEFGSLPPDDDDDLAALIK